MQLSEIIYNAIKGTISAFPMVAPEEASLPFAIYGYKKKPLRTKEGIYGYESDVQVVVVDDDLDNLEELSGTLIGLIEAIKGSNGISLVKFEGEQPDVLPEISAYKVELNFTIKQIV